MCSLTILNVYLFISVHAEVPQYFMKIILPWALEQERVDVSKLLKTYYKWAKTVEEDGVAENISKSMEEGGSPMLVELVRRRNQNVAGYVCSPSCVLPAVLMFPRW